MNLQKPKYQKLLFSCAVLAVTLTFSLAAAAQTETVLHNFNGAANDGANPERSGLLALGGNLYGVASFGGNFGSGVVYEIDRSGQLKVLYSFAGGNDGQYPVGPLTADSAGNLYGTTPSGGYLGGGIAYQLSKLGNGSWTETIIWSFGGSGDGANPYGGVVLDKNSNIYGTTADGGLYGNGTVFQISPTSGDTWSEQVIHNFGSTATDGWNPYDQLIIDASGNLYGTTAGGGSSTCDRFTLGCGTVFQVSPTAGGWVETVLHHFHDNGTDGFYTLSPLIMDKQGNLYGSTVYGGTGSCGAPNSGCGTVFKVFKNSSGGWGEQIIYSFLGNGSQYPDSAITFDPSENVYGETALSSQSQGTVYRLERTSGGFEATTLVTFTGNDGSNPQGGLTYIGGNLYGTTNTGGAENGGVVFEVVP